MHTMVVRNNGAVSGKDQMFSHAPQIVAQVDALMMGLDNLSDT